MIAKILFGKKLM